MKTKFVIASLLFAATILGSVSVVVKLQENVKKQIPKESIKAPPQNLPKSPSAQAPASSIQSKSYDALDAELNRLAEQKAEIEQQLSVTGFPTVLSDDRLGEAERAEILSRLQKASELQVKISQLKIRKIGFLGGDDL